MEVVFDYLHARRRRDLEALASLLHPDVVHQGVRPGWVCNGRDEVLARIEQTFPRDAAGIDHIELLDAGQRVVLGLAGPRFDDGSDGPRRGQVFLVFTVRDGRIARIEDHLTREEALRASSREAH